MLIFSEKQVVGLLKKISVPRSNHSKKLAETAELIKQQLHESGISYLVHPFILRPHKPFLVGATLLILALLFFYLMMHQRYVPALAVSALISCLLVIEFEIPINLVSRLISKKGENISATFKSPGATKELILSAHYDSKTDFLSPELQHKIQGLLIPVCAAGILIPAVLKVLSIINNSWQLVLEMIGVCWGGCYVFFWSYMALSLGGYIFIKHKNQSPGVVDNAAAVTALLSVAASLKHKKSELKETNVIFLFTCGEESARQGSLSYIKKKLKNDVANGALPRFSLNLELIGQLGNIMTWRRYGNFFRFMPGDKDLIQCVAKAVEEVTGNPLFFREKTTDDAVSFLKNGIPSLTVSQSGSPIFEGVTVHSIHDNMSRYSAENFKIMVQVLLRFIEDFSKQIPRLEKTNKLS